MSTGIVIKESLGSLQTPLITLTEVTFDSIHFLLNAQQNYVTSRTEVLLSN